MASGDALDENFVLDGTKWGDISESEDDTLASTVVVETPPSKKKRMTENVQNGCNADKPDVLQTKPKRNWRERCICDGTKLSQESLLRDCFVDPSFKWSISTSDFANYRVHPECFVDYECITAGQRDVPSLLSLVSGSSQNGVKVVVWLCQSSGRACVVSRDISKHFAVSNSNVSVIELFSHGGGSKKDKLLIENSKLERQLLSSLDERKTICIIALPAQMSKAMDQFSDLFDDLFENSSNSQVYLVLDLKKDAKGLCLLSSNETLSQTLSLLKEQFFPRNNEDEGSSCQEVLKYIVYNSD